MNLESDKKVLLTGIRASGLPHLGNFLGAIGPALDRQNKFKSYFFVADLHGLTTTPPAKELRDHVQKIAAVWLACGLDSKSTVLWKQSDVPEVLELMHVLTCVTSMGLLERAHSYKDALAKNKIVKTGLFVYPVLMAADILLFHSDFVPVGKDQAQHLEMTRDMATFFNETYGEYFKLPQALIQDEMATIPGTDGRKMSKSYDNGIEIFAPESTLKKQVMAIKTDSKSLQEPKIAEECLVYQIYKLVASSTDAEAMKMKLEAGGYGYGDAKKALLALLIEKFAVQRKEYERWTSDPGAIEAELRSGAIKAREIASKTTKQVRDLVGL